MKKYKIYRRRVETRLVYSDPDFYHCEYKFVTKPWEFYAEVEGVKEMINVLFIQNGLYFRTTNCLENFMKKRIVFGFDSTPENFNPVSPVDDYYLIKDEKNNIINPYLMLKPYFKKKRSRLYRWNIKEGKDYKYREGPVPCTGIKSRWYFSCYYRTFPKKYETDDEVLDEIKEYTRKYKVKDHEIPSTWDDIPRADYRNRNWKEYRRKQYKNTGISYRGKEEDICFDIEKLRKDLVKK